MPCKTSQPATGYQVNVKMISMCRARNGLTNQSNYSNLMQYSEIKSPSKINALGLDYTWLHFTVMVKSTVVENLAYLFKAVGGYIMYIMYDV